MLFSRLSILTMFHGMALGGGALLGLAAALFALRFLLPDGPGGFRVGEARALTILLVATAALLWFTTLGGTYLVFPAYRVPPPEGLIDLAAHPRSLLLSSPDTAWLHTFAMESKEHVPWIAAMLTTAVAFLGLRDRTRLLGDPRVRSLAITLLALSFALTAYVATLGVFVNKVAPLE